MNCDFARTLRWSEGSWPTAALHKAAILCFTTSHEMALFADNSWKNNRLNCKCKHNKQQLNDQVTMYVGF